MKLRTTIFESINSLARKCSTEGLIAAGNVPGNRPISEWMRGWSRRPSGCVVRPIHRFFAALPLVLICLIAPVGAQQNDGSFREFNRTLVPTPAELFRTLSVFNSDGVDTTDFPSGLNASVLEQLGQSGRELFSQMSPEQKKNAREFADNFLSENGLESEQGKALMNRLGIPSEMQGELAQQVKGWNPEEKKRFASLAEMFTPDQSRRSNPRQSGRSGSRNSRGGMGFRSNELSNDRSSQPNDLREWGQKASDNLGTDAQKKETASKFKSMFDGPRGTLSGSSEASAKPEERLTSRFDRLLVKAVKRSLEAKSQSSSDLELPESVKSTLQSVLGKVQDSINNKRESQAAIPPNSVPQRKNSEGGLVAQSDVDVSNGRPGNSDNDLAEASTVSSADMTGSFGGVPKINPSRLLLVMAMIGLVGFLVYLGWQYLSSESMVSAKGRLGRRFRSSRIRSPNDLVEAVDQAIVRNYGADARWWNANHAKEILCSSAPNFRASISDLLHDYVRARYSLHEPILSEVVQDQHKSTLRQLSNLRSDSKSSKESTNGNQG